MDTYDIKCRIIEEELRSVWPEWHVADHLGGGSFGDVFRIYRNNHKIREESALKVIQINDRMATAALPSNAQDGSQPDIPEALFSEIQIMEALRGAPNIVKIEDFSFKRTGQTSTLLVRMELLTSLQDVLPGRNGDGTLSSIGEIIKLGKDVCTALMYCERKGIIHRDIKPANLFVDEYGNYKVGDFGASKRMETVHVAQSMTGIGTISYMAPEIFRGQSYNNTVDIYALGLVLYQLLNNGRMAFLSESGSYTTLDIDSANYQRLHGTPVPSLYGKCVAGERISRRLDAAVRKACAMDPADRYRTAEEFYDALALAEMPEKKTGAEAGEGTSAALQQDDLPSVSILPSQPQEKKQPGGVKFVIAIVLVCIVVAATVTLGILQRGKGSMGSSASSVGSSAGTEQSVAANTEGSGSEEESKDDDSGTGTVVAETVTAERDPGPISDSWDDIIAAGEDGTYINKYQIGDTKELDLGEEGVIEMELVAFDTDELADGSGKAHMTWIAKDLLNTKHVMNEGKKSTATWPDSGMRTWLQDSILPLFPDTVRSNIKEVKKSSSTYYSDSIISTDTIWIPSRVEMYGGYEPEYITAYPDDASRIKTRAGEPEVWWLRNYCRDYKFVYVDTQGVAWELYNGIHALGVAVGFCL